MMLISQPPTDALKVAHHSPVLHRLVREHRPALKGWIKYSSLTRSLKLKRKAKKQPVTMKLSTATRMKVRKERESSWCRLRLTLATDCREAIIWAEIQCQ